MVTVSIIIPVYNVENYIVACLDSIIAQESENVIIECILVNDCSPDGSMSVVAERLKGYKGNIQFIIKYHITNQGHCVARNTGIEVSRGDYLLFVDADDRLKPHAISYYLDCLNSMKDPSKIDVVMGNAYSSYNLKPIMPIGDGRPVLIDNAKEEALHKILTKELFHTSWNKMIRRDFLMEHQLFFEPGIINEDFLWSYLVFLKVRQILFLPRVTYFYEYNSQSITFSSHLKLVSKIRSRIVVCNKILDFPPKSICQEYYTYVFSILLKVVDLFERNKREIRSLEEGLWQVRDRLLAEVRRHGYYLIYLFFLTSVKPLYYLTKMWFFRRYFDRIVKVVTSSSKAIHEPWFA